MFQIALSATTPEEIDAFTAEWLQGRGYTIIPPNQEETPRELCRRLGISGDTLRRRLRSRWCPPIPVSRSASGRLVALASYADGDCFLKTGKRVRPQKLHISPR